MKFLRILDDMKMCIGGFVKQIFKGGRKFSWNFFLGKQ